MNTQLLNPAMTSFADWVLDEIDPEYLRIIDYVTAMELTGESQWVLWD